MEAREFLESVGTDYVTNYGLSITSANLVMTDGKSLENIGVTPDQMLIPRASDLAEGSDPVLANVAERAGLKISPAEAGKLFPYEWPSL
jgi:C-terminal processing protease CtpA/Prc